MIYRKRRRLLLSIGLGETKTEPGDRNPFAESSHITTTDQNRPPSAPKVRRIIEHVVVFFVSTALSVLLIWALAYFLGPRFSDGLAKVSTETTDALHRNRPWDLASQYWALVENGGATPKVCEPCPPIDDSDDSQNERGIEYGRPAARCTVKPAYWRLCLPDLTAPPVHFLPLTPDGVLPCSLGGPCDPIAPAEQDTSMEERARTSMEERARKWAERSDKTFPCALGGGCDPTAPVPTRPSPDGAHSPAPSVGPATPPPAPTRRWPDETCPRNYLELCHGGIPTVHGLGIFTAIFFLGDLFFNLYFEPAPRPIIDLIQLAAGVAIAIGISVTVHRSTFRRLKAILFFPYLLFFVFPLLTFACTTLLSYPVLWAIFFVTAGLHGIVGTPEASMGAIAGSVSTTISIFSAKSFEAGMQELVSTLFKHVAGRWLH